MTGRALLILGMLVGIAPDASSGQDVEEILTYDVAIDVENGGLMSVREAIRVRVLGREIRRGIYRDLPTSFPRWIGLGRIEAPLAVRSVTRDGAPEPYSLEAIGGPVGREGVRIRIGNANVLLDHGVHDYVIEYETSRWVEFGEDRDRLYWNVTGNGWDFPIRSASARVRIDGLTTPPELQSWSGPEGSTTTTAMGRWSSEDRAAVFETEGTLRPREGLTVAVTFPDGRLAPPDEERRAAWFRLDWGGWIDTGYVGLFVIAVYLLMWRRVGIDPPPARTGATPEPPDGYSPAALGYIEGRGYEESQLSAALVNMALKGAIRIEEDDGVWTLEKVSEPQTLEEKLSEEEAALFGSLLANRTRIRLERSNHVTLQSAIKAFRSSLARRLEREYFVNNRAWFGVGLAISVVGFATLAWRWRFAINPVALFLGFWLTGWSAGVGSLVYRLAQQFRMARAGGGTAVWAGTGFLALFSVPFIVAEVVVAGILFTMVPAHLVVGAVAIGLTNVLFYHLLERPTLKGRGVLDRLEGFRSYLGRGMDAERPVPPRPPERLRRYERFLPFAIALGVERRWTDAFGDVLGPALAAPMSRPYLSWYRSGDPGTSPEPGQFASSLATGLSSSLSSMSAPPSSSSGGGGFSGGGSSGGGGGGGGGGGW